MKPNQQYSISFYFDDSHFKFSERFFKKRNVYIIAGFSIRACFEIELEKLTSEIKKKYKLQTHHPVKWNLKDSALKRFYESLDELKTYEHLLEISDDIREELIGALLKEEFGVSLFASIYVRLKSDGKIFECYDRCLTNLLQRIVTVAEKINCFHNVYLDYFKEEESFHLAKSYWSGFNFGKDLNGNEYKLGNLKEKGFSLGLYFGKAIFNPFLQLADLIAGCVSAFAEYCFAGEKSKLAERFFPLICLKFHKPLHANDPFKYGIVVSPDDYYEKMEQKYWEIISLLYPAIFSEELF